jgi:hypothetical protein
MSAHPARADNEDTFRQTVLDRAPAQVPETQEGEADGVQP